MMTLLQIDWSGMLTPDAPLMESVLRGTVISFALLVLLRLTPRRTVGSIGIMALLVVVLIAEAAGKAMGEYDTLTEGIVLVATLVGWSYLLNWLPYAVPAIDRLVSPLALPVVRDGRLLRRTMRAEFLTEAEVVRQLRLDGVKDLGEVKVASVEGDGSLSVTKHEGHETRLAEQSVQPSTLRMGQGSTPSASPTRKQVRPLTLWIIRDRAIGPVQPLLVRQ